MTEAILNLDTTPEQLIARYIELRDQKQADEKRAAELIKTAYTTPMEEIEMQLLDMLNKIGVSNLPTAAGKAIKMHRTSVTVADQREFRRHIIGQELWDLIEWRPAKTAINDLIDNGEPLPPGLNRTVFLGVNIRRNS